MTDILTINHASELGDLISAINSSSTARVRWIDDNEITRSGIIRSINPYDGENKTGAINIRDMHLRITLDTAGEMYMPIRTVLDLRSRGQMFIRP